MSTVLESIIEGVLEDLEARSIPISTLKRQLDEAGPLRGALAALSSSAPSGKNATKIIAEVKRASPSKGALNDIARPAELAAKYESGGASVVSVLTEERRFKGSIADFREVRNEITIPMLRKDFIVTDYQVIESRLLGADLLLLIVAGLTQSQYVDFHQMANELGMDVLVEVHTEEELERAMEASPSIVGINSRNLKTLDVDPSAFHQLIPLIPDGVIKVAESGISERSEVALVEELGAHAILVGETLVRAGDPESAISRLLGR
jgi:indole-3-glycerol phosphate synthase